MFNFKILANWISETFSPVYLTDPFQICNIFFKAFAWRNQVDGADGSGDDVNSVAEVKRKDSNWLLHTTRELTSRYRSLHVATHGCHS